MISQDYLDSSRVVRGLKNGPLGQYFDLCVERHRQAGYSHVITQRFLSLMQDFGHWLRATGKSVEEIEEAVVRAYLTERARHRPTRQSDAQALRRLLTMLREANVIPPRQLLRVDPRELIAEAYRVYLVHKRGLVATSVASHVWFLLRFLNDIGIRTNSDLGRLTARRIARYVEKHAHDHGPTTARIMCSRLRVFLRYLNGEGLIDADLTTAIPSIRRIRGSHLPSFMPLEEVQRILDRCDKSTALGRRDYAILMLLARLGLRACEVAMLSLDDFDWHTGQFTVRGKGRKTAIMPLPPDVGEAIAAYPTTAALVRIHDDCS